MRVAMVKPLGGSGMTYETFEQIMNRIFGRPKAVAKPVAKAQSKPAQRPAQAPQRPVTQDSLWRDIVASAGGDDPVKIDTFLQTPAGRRMYAQYRALG